MVNKSNTLLISGAIVLYKVNVATMLSAQVLTCVNNNSSEAILSEYLKVYGKQPSNIDITSERPNILFITSDQHFWAGVGYNDPSVKTPNLDRLAKMGVVYDRAYTCNPVSTPTRSSMITGLYPSQHGAFALGTKLPENIPTIGNYLQRANYKSALIGKAHFMPLAGNATYPSMEAYPILQDFDFWKRFSGPFYGFEYVQLARNHGDESHVGQHYAIWMENKLRLQGKNDDEWKNWFLKPGTLEYANIDQKMRLVVDENGANGSAQAGVWNIPEEYHMNSFIAEQTRSTIDKFTASGQPFFIWSSFFDPHPPYLVPEPWASMYNPDDMEIPEVPQGDMNDMPYHYRMTQTSEKGWGKEYDEDGFDIHGLSNHNLTKKQHQKNKALYYGMISYMDKYIGLILNHLESKGLLDKTVIVFTTDHGHHIGSHNLAAKGGFAYEEDLRIPFIVSWKGKYPSDTRSSALVSVVDIAPTFLKIAGYTSTPTMSGIDLTPLFSGEEKSLRKWVISENHFQRTKFYQKTYIEDRYKITWYMQSEDGELFDLLSDPGEHVNLWKKPEFQRLKMDMMLRAMQADMQKDPCWMPRLGPA